jgi:hypothetical protein
MKIIDKTGIEIELDYDEDGYPLVSISAGGGYTGEHQRPAVQVQLNGVEIHDMFNAEDRRWNPARKRRSIPGNTQVTIYVSGGVVTDVDLDEEKVAVTIRDYDVEGLDEDLQQRILQDEFGDHAASVYGHGSLQVDVHVRGGVATIMSCDEGVDVFVDDSDCPEEDES